MGSPRTIAATGAVLTAGAALAAYSLTTTSSQQQPVRPAIAVQVAALTSSTTTSTITRATVLARARTWHPHASNRIPYSQNRTYGGYRTDCSGYASMALALGKPGTNTVGLASSTYSTRISMSSLLPGDLVIDATGTSNTRHAVIFVKWTSSKHTSYYEYEQRGGYGTDYRTTNYGLTSGSQYHAYRPKKIR